MYIYSRIKKIDGWLVADAGLMGLLLGQAGPQRDLDGQRHGREADIDGERDLHADRASRYRDLPSG